MEEIENAKWLENGWSLHNIQNQSTETVVKIIEELPESTFVWTLL